MIYSPDHNFLLLKNHKVGGTSLEVPLSMIVPDNAIVTPKTSDNPAWKLDEPKIAGYKPRNYEIGFYNHIPYVDIANKLDLSKANAYVFVRHPYKAVLSDFFHRLYFIQKNFIWNTLEKEERQNLVDRYFNDDLGWIWYRSSKNIYLHYDGSLAVKKILYYENGIEDEINAILPLHKLPKIQLKIKEKAFRPTNIAYTDVFDQTHLKMIQDSWQWEFENLGYSA
jgi:hypothetical protein